MEYNKSLDIQDQANQILTLQNLIHETMEESTLSASEIKRLADDNERLKQENLDLKEAMVQQQQQVELSFLRLLTKYKLLSKPEILSATKFIFGEFQYTLNVPLYKSSDNSFLISLVTPVNIKIYLFHPFLGLD